MSHCPDPESHGYNMGAQAAASGLDRYGYYDRTIEPIQPAIVVTPRFAHSWNHVDVNNTRPQTLF
jgi:hypothetical protein